MKKEAYVYIMTNLHRSVLYIGVTSNLERRVFEHKSQLLDGFSKKYNTSNLVYYEIYGDINEAIQREKQLKDSNRARKERLIKRMNPQWVDLYDEVIKDNK